MCSSKLLVIASIFLGSISSAIALPARSPAEALEKLQGRSQCNADNCLNALRHRGPSATDFCISYISAASGTVTLTSWAAATSTPATETLTTTIPTTITSSSLATVTVASGDDLIFKRTATTAPISAVLVSSCTPSPSAPATYRISSACSCLLGPSTSTTATITLTSTSTLSTPVVEQTIVPTVTVTSASTSTAYIPAATVAATCQNLPQTYTAPNTEVFIVKCGYQYYNGNTVAEGPNSSFGGCVNACAYSPTCIAVTWDDGNAYCKLLGSLTDVNNGVSQNNGIGGWTSGYDGAVLEQYYQDK